MLGGGVARAIDRALGLGARDTRDELMDTVRLSPAAVSGTLRFLELANLRFGGIGVVLRHLAEWSVRWPPRQPIRLLDVGTGAADIPRAVVSWARRSGFAVQVTAIDVAPDIVEGARARANGDPAIAVEECDVFALAGTGCRFDYVIASLFLHHVPDRRTGEALLAFDRLATRGVIISDLLRSPSALLAVWAVSRLAGNAIVRHDAPLSVCRGFRTAELSQLAERLRLPYLEARREAWFRVSLSGEKPAGRG